MTMNPDDREPKSNSDFEVRYSDKFLRNSRREGRRTMLFGAVLFLLTGIGILFETLQAYRNGTWVDLGPRINTPVLFPPIVGAAVGVFALLLSLYLVFDQVRRK